MSISFQCPGCGKSYQTDAARAGRRGRCKSCGAMMTVPQVSVGAEKDSEEFDSYALEDPPLVETAAPEPSSFVRTANDSDGRTPREKKPRKGELLDQVRGEAEEVVKSYAGVIRKTLIAAVVLAIVMGIVAAAVPNGTFIAGAILIGSGLLIILAGYFLGAYIAFTEDLLHAALFVTIPLYTGYYIVTNWDEMWRPFALMIVGGILLSVGATVLESTQEEEPEMFAPVEIQMRAPSSLLRESPLLADILG